MKKVFTLAIIFISFFITQDVFAAMSPAEPFCEHQGYDVVVAGHPKELTLCQFDDGKSCEVWNFYNGKCGLEYRRDFSCVEQGKPVFSFDTCCDGLVPHARRNLLGQGTCQPKIKALKENIIDYTIYNPIAWVIGLILLAGIIIVIKRRKYPYPPTN